MIYPLLNIKIYVIIHKMILKQKKNQKKHTTASLTYELGLLRQRNSILAQQNQNLIEKVQELQRQLALKQESLESLNLDRQFRQSQKTKFTQMLEKRIKDMNALVFGTSEINNSKNLNTKNSIKNIQELLKNKCNPTTIASALFDVLEQLWKQNMVVRPTHEQKYRKIQNELLMRKKAAKSQKIMQQNLYVVKQPNYYPTSYSVLSYADIPYLMQLYEKLVLKTKKQCYSLVQINELFQRIRSTVPLRKKLSQLLSQVGNLQRQLEIGKARPQILVSLNQSTDCIQKQYENTKKKVQKEIDFL